MDARNQVTQGLLEEQQGLFNQRTISTSLPSNILRLLPLEKQIQICCSVLEIEAILSK